jgi:hypothetical protein
MAHNTPCDHPDHGTDSPWHRDGSPHHVIIDVPCGHFGPPPGMVVTVCGQWVKTLRQFLCTTCGATYGTDIVTFLGPIGGIR